MPIFELVPQQEAEMKSATGPRSKIMREYLGYVEQVGPGKAGKLQPSEGETVGAVRRRIGAAARRAGKDLVIKRVGDEVYFWKAGGEVPRRGRGRPRKDQ